MIPAPTVTGWSTFWKMIAPPTQGADYAPYGNRSSEERRIALHIGKPGYRGVRKIIRTLLGQATGNLAADSYTRVVAPVGLTQSSQLGGARVMETVTTVNRNTTAADLTYAQGLVDRVFNAEISSYPVDLSGNGGGGKRGR